MQPDRFIKIFLTFLVLALVRPDTAVAQSSFIVRFDGQHHSMLPNKVMVCSDGGYLIAQVSNDNYWTSTPYLIKTDSMGQVEWLRHFPSVAPLLLQMTRNVIQLPDSGFLYVGVALDFMYGTYAQSVIRRLDRSGNTLTGQATSWGSFATEGYSIHPYIFNETNGSVVAFSESYTYDGTGGPCCYQYFIMELDTFLNPVMVKEIAQEGIKTMQKIVLNGTVTGYVAGTEYGARLIMFDTSGNILWSKMYGYGRINKIIQDDSTLVMLGLNTFNSNLLEAFIHRTDLSGNTLSIKMLSATDKIWLTDVIRRDSVYLIAAMATPRIPLWTGYLRPRGIMFSTDLSGNILQSYSSNDSLFTFAGFDTLRKAFLFARGYDPSISTGFDFIRLSMDTSACGFLPYTITSSDTVINEVVIVQTADPDSLQLFQATPLFFDTVITSTAICVTTSVSEPADPADRLIIFPNPVQDYLNIQIKSATLNDPELALFDIYGREIYRKNLNREDTHFRVPVVNWRHGIYFVRYINGGRGMSAKFLKN